MRFLLLGLFFFSAPSFSQSICEFKVFRFGEISLQTGRLGHKNCFIKLSGFKKGDAFRSHLFTKQGLYQVFNSFSNFQTGAKEFWFNELDKLKFYQNKDGDLIVSLKNNLSLTFNTQTGMLIDGKGISLYESGLITPEERAGVSLIHSDLPLIEFPFHFGSSPRSIKKGSFSFINNDLRCSFRNQEYIDQSSSNAFWKKSIKRTFKLLNQKCF